MSHAVTAVVLAAGAGTRMKSRTAKVLHEIGGRSLVAHALHALSGAGASRTVVVVGHGREQVGPHVEQVAPHAQVVVQHEQNGTGHAVAEALAALPEAVTGTVLVTYGDVPLLEPQTLAELLTDHHAHDRAVTILTAEVPDPTGYGRILRDASGAVTAIREHKDASDDERLVREVNSGILALDAAFLARALPRLEAKNAQGELYLTDVVAGAVAEGGTVGAFMLADPVQVEGVNDRVQLATLGAELNRRTTERWMREGVTIVDPATTWLDVTVELASDVTLLPGTQLHGATRVASGATVGPDTTLRDVVVGEDATVERTHGSDAVIGAGATVGPFAYLRPGTELGERGKIGTFVETKNSRIGAGSKVPHLSYVGDTEVGESSNIGAGTITANYDGVTKSRTQVGHHVRTGSHNVFVAPVSIGDGAYTGAGTVVRQDVEPGALAVPETGQRTIGGWVPRRRPGSAAADAALNAAPNLEDNAGE